MEILYHMNVKKSNFKSSILDDFLSHKKQTEKISSMAKYIEDNYSFDYGSGLETSPEYWNKRSINLNNCGSFLEFAYDCDDIEYTKLVNANFCKYRLCPCCNWRKSLKTYSSTSRMIDFLKNEKLCKKYGFEYCNYRYIFATFTVKNVDGEHLDSAIDSLLFGYSHRLLRRKDIKDGIKGSIRQLEVTYNRKSDTFHPHLHCIFLVDASYFRENYITFDKFVKFARDSFKCDYNPSTDIRAIKEDELDNAVCEVSKYPVKYDSVLDYEDGNIEDYEKSIYVLRTLDNCLYHRRLVSYTGVFKKLRSLLRDEDITSNDEDLINIDGQELEVDRNLFVRSFRYNSKSDSFEYVSDTCYEDWKFIHDVLLVSYRTSCIIEKIKNSLVLCKLDEVDALLDKLHEVNYESWKVWRYVKTCGVST